MLQHLERAGRGSLLGGALAAAAVSLQGCQVSIPRHTVPNWLLEPSYLKQFEYTRPGGGSGPRLNSCEDPSMPVTLQCSGHGRCVDWLDIAPSMDLSQHRLTFCECDLEWADPECSTPRRSQLSAFLLSIFLGMFGADQFYLGYIWPHGILKLVSLGGLGVWWIYDIVRIGSSPVMTSSTFRVANDVHHWAFVLVVICFMGFLGFGLSIWSINYHRKQKARELILLRADGPRGAVPSRRSGNMGPPAFTGYGTTLAASAPSATPGRV